MAHQVQKRAAARRDGSVDAERRSQDRSSAPGREEPVAESVIAEAAYYRWQHSGGDPESNWLAAERECRARAGLLGGGES